MSTGGITNFSAVQVGFDTGTDSAAAVTINHQTGIITTASLTGVTGRANGSPYAITLTDQRIQATSQLITQVGLGTATSGSPYIQSVVCSSGSAVITIGFLNTVSTNGTFVLPFWVLNPQST